MEEFRKIDTTLCCERDHIYRTALHEGRIVPLFQPIIKASDGSVLKYEALARLQLADGTLVSPCDFLHVADEEKVFEFFTKQMMHKVFHIYGKTFVDISVNVTYEDIRSQGTLRYIQNRLETYGGERMTFEIVKMQEIEDYELIENFILNVKKYGCKISVDNFTSDRIEYIGSLESNIDFLKLDGVSTPKSVDEEKTKLAVAALLEYTHNIRIKTIAKFVSSSEISKGIQELGVDYLQGYHHGKPKDAKIYGLV